MEKKLPPVLYFFEDCNQHDYPEQYRFRFKKHRAFKQGLMNGKHGLFIMPFDCDAQSPFILDTDTAKYRWSKLPENTMLGIRENIDPAELLNPDAVPGLPCELADGNTWFIPVANLSGPNFSLPRYETMDECGKWIWEVEDRYAHLCVFAEEVFRHFDKDKFSMDEIKLRNICCAVLAVNYNVTDVEAGAMKILTQDGYMKIIGAVIDLPGAQEIIEHIEGKKKLSADGDTNFGERD